MCMYNVLHKEFNQPYIVIFFENSLIFWRKQLLLVSFQNFLQMRPALPFNMLRSKPCSNCYNFFCSLWYYLAEIEPADSHTENEHYQQSFQNCYKNYLSKNKYTNQEELWVWWRWGQSHQTLSRPPCCWTSGWWLTGTCCWGGSLEQDKTTHC